MPHWFVSFASKTESLGAVVVEADSEKEAADKVEKEGLQPDPMPEGAVAAVFPAGGMDDECNQALLNKYHTQEEAVAIGLVTTDSLLDTMLKDILAEKGMTIADLDDNAKKGIVDTMVKFVDENAQIFRHHNE